MTTIVLAEDHAIVREGLRRILEEPSDLSVVAETGDGLEAIRLVECHRPDVLILDLRMPGLHGLEVVRRVHAEWPSVRVVVLSRHADDSYVAESLEGGAHAYVLKDSAADELTRAIREVLAGERYLAPPLSERGVRSYLRHAREDSERADPYRRLTPREREVFQLTAEGYTSREIGGRLSISPRTVEKHQAHIREKLDLHSKAELIEYAHRRGLVGPSSESDSS